MRFGVDLDAEPAAQPLQRDLLVGLAQAPQDDLVGVRVLLQAQGGVLRDQPRQRVRELVLVRLPVRPHRRREQRVRGRPGLDEDRVPGGGEGVAGLRLAEAGHADQIARDAPVHGVLVPAERRGQGGHPDLRLVTGAWLLTRRVQAVAAQVHGVVGPQGAGEDPHQRDPARVRVGRRLDDLRQQRGLRITGRGGSGRAGGCGDDRRGALQRGREAARDQFQQLHRADALPGALGRGGGGQYGEEGAPGDGPFQVRDQCRYIDTVASAVEVPVHQRLVLALGDDPFDQPVTGLRQRLLLVRRGRQRGPLPGGVVQDPLREQPGQPGERGVPVGGLGAEDRQIEREYGVGVVPAEGLRADPGHLLEGGARGVEMGDDDRPGHPDERALLPHRPGRRGHGLGLLRCRDDEEGRVRRPQTGPQLPDEVGVPGVSSRLTLQPSHVTGTAERWTERCRRRSISSWSETVAPSSTRPARSSAPAVRAKASTSVVLPEPLWPTSTTFRTAEGWPAAGTPPAAPGCACVFSPMVCLPVDDAVREGEQPTALDGGYGEPPRRPRSFELGTRAPTRPYVGRGARFTSGTGRARP